MRIFKNKMFFKWAESEGLTDSVLSKAAKEIREGLINGNLGGDIVKKRVARKGEGKRSGYRTIVAFRKEQRTIFIYGFPKNERENISKKEENALKKLAQFLLEAPEKKLKQMLANGDLYEVKDEHCKKKEAPKHTGNCP